MTLLKTLHHSGLDPLNRSTPLRGEQECKDWRAGDCVTDWERTHDAIDYYMKEVGNPEINLRMVGLNSKEHLGGAHCPGRGWLNIYSTGHEKTTKFFLHETGHIAGFLADEYVTDQNATYSGDFCVIYFSLKPVNKYRFKLLLISN